MTGADAEAWITGIGILGPQGCGWDAVVRGLQQPTPLFQPVPPAWQAEPGVPAAWTAPLAADAEAALQPFDTASADRACAMALAAADQAWRQAGAEPQPRRGGVWWGTGMGGAQSTEQSYRRFLLERAALRPMTVPRIMASSPAAQIATRHGLRGPNLTYAIACASAATAIGEALLALRVGRVDLAIAGGSESMLQAGVLAGWQGLRVLSTLRQAETAAQACRPFGAGRSGLVLGEGAAALVLERPASARARGARPLAILAGYGSNCDAAPSLVHPQADGEADAMRQALADAGAPADAVGLVNAHGTGTDAGDVAEAEALAAVFGTGRAAPAVCATKSHHGHLLGAAGAMEAVVSIASLVHQLVPATLGAEPRDPRCAHLQLAAQPTGRPLDWVLSNSFAFGGANVSLLFGRAPA
ncbi:MULTISPECIES: beta-ketoacyl-[acyl-carrier-protein] synthase family protein [Ramlibacter]|uniref:Nodulation protein E n=1 Tax=Ramlibacter pinisoli TaxID=2682844 RepID=A0A6N8J3I5_9BURK|nr:MULTISPECIES: beta-ketoacyl-[acyl-carrier-protein] synthase family protein [Ramlibacter]MBA2962947.1 beta-ketoacyl-[acyl-carrier-protein] synthase family protein [Ramlibacter sp. CGMCC 1.13660]MVQ32890.1 beta-ketoacyl-[acyl-carrier-protein] synthase family protein [Ramlibacter pinisoli]